MRQAPRLLGAFVIALGGLTALGPAAAADVGLDTTVTVASVEPSPSYNARPLTIEVRARVDDPLHYNILIANETKASPTHWELFTMPGSGFLTAYLPGYEPDHIRSECPVADGQWHDLALGLESNRGRLYVNGQIVADTPMAPKGELVTAAAPLFIGSLVERSISCDAVIAWMRISNAARPAAPLGEEPPTADADTVGLWQFAERDASGLYADLSAAGRPARPVPAQAFDRIDITKLTAEQAGEMQRQQFPPTGESIATKPPAIDLAESRRSYQEAFDALTLACLAGKREPRDGLLADWEEQRYRLGRQLSGEEPLPPGAAESAYDREALVYPEDGDALGVILRRTRALLRRLEAMPSAPDLKRASEDLSALEGAARAIPAADAEPRRAYFLLASALLREVAFSNPLLDFDRILFVAHGNYLGSRLTGSAVTMDVWGQHFATQYFGFNSIPGGGLFVLEDYKSDPRVTDLLAGSVVENGRLAGRKLEPGAYLSPDLSYDGNDIVFAYTENKEHRWIWSPQTTWNLWRVRSDGTGLRQLTDSPYDDFDPVWLPSGRVAFISERRGGYIRCFLGLHVPSYVLHSMKPDGSDVYPLSYFETSEWHPSVDNDGMIVYTRWDYTDRENCLGSNLWLCYPDGRDPRGPHGNYPYPWHTFADNTLPDVRFSRPYVEMSIRAVPDSHLYIMTAAPHHGEAYGALAMLDLREPDDGCMSQIKKITPYVPFPETQVQGRSQYPYGTPWPLSEDFYLCNWWENLYLLDRFGNQVLLLENPLVFGGKLNPDMRLIDPIPMKPRPMPPVIPSQTNQGEDAVPGKPPATISVMNVYDTDEPLPPGERIRWLRVTQNILKTNPWMGVPMIGYQNESTPRVPLGIVPVEEDGSVYFEAPIERELIFQTLDEHYRAIHSMRAVAYVHPGEQLTCMGCHEPRQSSPKVSDTPLALQREPSRLEPEVGPIEPISYYRTVKPVFERACMACHQQTGAEPQNWDYAALEPYVFYFAGGMSGETVKPIHGGSRTIPGRFGARYCRMGNALFDNTHRDKVTDEDRHRIVLWLDSNSLRLTAYENEEAQMRGELVWPSLDVDPSNPQGLERGG